MNKSALIIDDNKDLADGLATMLEFEDIDSVTAYTGEEGMSLLEERDFDICITDVKLPDINGVDMFSAAKTKNPDMQVIIMSGFRMEQVTNEILSKGSTSVLQSEINPQMIVNILNPNSDVLILLVVDRTNTVNVSEKSFINALGYKRITVMSTLPKTDSELKMLKDSELIIFNLDKPVVWALAAASKLHKLNPEMRFLIKLPNISSGKTAIPLQSFSVTGCLFKPFSPEKILDLVNDNRVLNRKAAL